MKKSWGIWFSIFVILILIPLIVAIVTGFWSVSAISVGLLFGFVLQKGDLCGASAMSEIIIFRDFSKIFGIWVAIVSSMVFFAILQLFGIIELAPKKFIWLNALVGGFIFGIGTVLAGGCISGCLYKGPSGNINSIVALLTIPVGVSAVDYGFLKNFHESLLKFTISGPNGEPLTLYSVTNLPYWLLVLFFLIITLLFALLYSKKEAKNKFTSKSKEKFSLLTKPWKPWQSGIAIGIIGMLAWLSSLPTGRNYPLGVTHGVSYLYQLVVEKNVQVVKGKTMSVLPSTVNQTQSQSQPVVPTPRKLNLWLMLLILGVVTGSFLSSKMTGNFAFLPKPPDEILIAAIGGFVVGVGAGIGTGCVIGNIISGWAMMSLSMFIFGITTLLGNWLATYVYLIGIGKAK